MLRAKGQINAPGNICIHHIRVAHGQEQYFAMDGLIPDGHGNAYTTSPWAIKAHEIIALTTPVKI